MASSAGDARHSGALVAARSCLIAAVALTACGGPGSGPVDDVSPSAETTAVLSASPRPSLESSSPDAVGDDEAWIVYQWVAGSGDGIYLVRPDGTGRHQLVPEVDGSEIHPDWSPDGNRIAFVRQAPEGHTELWVVDAGGTDAERFYSCELPCNEIHSPDWSTDGAYIYFSQNADVPPGEEIPRTFSIGRLELATGEASVVLSRDDGMIVEQARVSPDGDTIAYMGGSEEVGGTAIFTVPVDGGPEAQLTEYEMFGAHPDWTPAGQIVFHSENLLSPEQPGNLFVMDANGANLEQLTQLSENGQRAFQPRVAPDGSGIVFIREESGGPSTRRIALLEAGASEPVWLTPEPIAGTHAQLRPGGR